MLLSLPCPASKRFVCVCEAHFSLCTSVRLFHSSMSWRNSKNFEQFLVRMMGVMAFGTAGVMGVLLLVKRNHDFGEPGHAVHGSRRTRARSTRSQLSLDSG